jgi:O-glycosyl hydrolase
MSNLQKVLNVPIFYFKNEAKGKRSYHVIFAAKIILLLFGILIFFPFCFAHPVANLTVDGSRHFQTIDGFGVNINSLSWKNGELKPAIDMLADEMGSTMWRVVFDQEDWEAVNDNPDPNVFNWDYYNGIYSSAKFRNLWGTIGYLNQKGFSTNIIMSFMGNVSDWMGGTRIKSAEEDEWVEMIASLVYYARNKMHLSFSMLDPLNETDWGHNEGPLVEQVQYTRLLHKLSVKLDSIGLGDIKFIGPTTAGIVKGVDVYMPVMMRDSVVMAKVDHFGLHSYASADDNAYQSIKNSAYPDRNYYITETTLPETVFYELLQGTSAVMIWEGYDSVYKHAVLMKGVTTPPNDPGPGPALLAYDKRTGSYSPRKCFYEYENIFKFVPSGSTRISASQSDSNVDLLAFYNQPSGCVTIMGRNFGAKSVSYTGKLVNLPHISTLKFYVTSETDSNMNFLKGNDISLKNGALSFVAPAKSIFTLTGLVDRAGKASHVKKSK